MAKKLSEINEVEEELVGKPLILMIAKYATRVGREAIKAKGAERKAELSTAIGLLNQAQALVAVSPAKSRRVLNLAMRLI